MEAYRVPVQIGGYRLIERKGTGSTSMVYSGLHLATKHKVAVKVISQSVVGPNLITTRTKLERETVIMQMLRHPNIIAMIEVLEDEMNIYVIMEYAKGGSLREYLDKLSHPISEEKMLFWCQQIVSALHYCHSHGVVHRDLKEENLLLDKEGNIKIADFGYSSKFSRELKLSTSCGTPTHAAPEIFLGKPYLGPEVDAWSLGVILYSMIANRVPFYGEDLMKIAQSVLYTEPPPIPKASPQLTNLITGLLEKDPRRRMTIPQVMIHPWTTANAQCRIVPFVHVHSMSDLNANIPHDFHERIVAKMIKLGFNKPEIDACFDDSTCSDAYATYRLLESKFMKEGKMTVEEQKSLEIERLNRHEQVVVEANESAIMQAMNSTTDSTTSMSTLSQSGSSTPSGVRSPDLDRQSLHKALSTSSHQDIVVPINDTGSSLSLKARLTSSIKNTFNRKRAHTYSTPKHQQLHSMFPKTPSYRQEDHPSLRQTQSKPEQSSSASAGADTSDLQPSNSATSPTAMADLAVLVQPGPMRSEYSGNVRDLRQTQSKPEYNAPVPVHHGNELRATHSKPEYSKSPLSPKSSETSVTSPFSHSSSTAASPVPNMHVESIVIARAPIARTSGTVAATSAPTVAGAKPASTTASSSLGLQPDKSLSVQSIED